jgi:hypothetical protein
VGFVVNEVSLRQISFRVFWFSPDSSIPLMLHARPFIYNQYYIIFWRHGFSRRQIHVGSVVDQVALRQIFLQVFQFSRASVFPSMFSTHLFIHYQHFMSYLGGLGSILIQSVWGVWWTSW